LNSFQRAGHVVDLSIVGDVHDINARTIGESELGVACRTFLDGLLSMIQPAAGCSIARAACDLDPLKVPFGLVGTACSLLSKVAPASAWLRILSTGCTSRCRLCRCERVLRPLSKI
jgi:hypothetical protein